MRTHLFAISVFLTSACLALPAAAPPARPNLDKKAEKAIREVAGTAEFLRALPKRFGTLVSVDVQGRRVRIRFDADKHDYEWPLTEDAEVKVDGWWGRLGQLVPGERVWVWLKTNRKNDPVAVAMLADDLSQQDIQGGLTVKANGAGKIVLAPETGAGR